MLRFHRTPSPTSSAFLTRQGFPPPSDRRARPARLDPCGTKEMMRPCLIYLHAISLIRRPQVGQAAAGAPGQVRNADRRAGPVKHTHILFFYRRLSQMGLVILSCQVPNAALSAHGAAALKGPTPAAGVGKHTPPTFCRQDMSHRYRESRRATLTFASTQQTRMCVFSGPSPSRPACCRFASE